jgi:hypothetical protein
MYVSSRDYQSSDKPESICCCSFLRSRGPAPEITTFESSEESVFCGFNSGVLVDEKLSPGEGEGDRVICLDKLSMFRKGIAET